MAVGLAVRAVLEQDNDMAFEKDRLKGLLDVNTCGNALRSSGRALALRAELSTGPRRD
jgi:hypothetical protein